MEEINIKLASYIEARSHEVHAFIGELEKVSGNKLP